MKIEHARYAASALNLEACPESELPEFAFVGRSNVGKSSLINLLTNQKELAHTSAKPGKTRLINFFRINDYWHLVDLPGYGYAKVSKGQQQKFNVHVSEYLTQRKQLKQVFVLIDSKIEPQEGDLAFVQWLEECTIPYSIVFTKTDRSSETQVKDNMELFVANLDAWGFKPNTVLRCSAKTGKGRGAILNWIEGKLPKGKAAGKKKSLINTAWMKR